MAVNQQESSLGQLVELSKTGCLDSFGSLVEQYETRLLHFLMQLTRNSHDAEDLAQETFLKAYRSLSRYDARFSFVSWLFTIARRTAVDHFRARRPTEEIDPEQEEERTDPAGLLESKDEESQIWRKARQLKPAQYEALWLRYGQGFSVAETAQVMNTNQIRVKVLLHRARTQLAKWLGDAISTEL
jgi:RNA polymerase sigma-70 factor (ECF subfamily)